MWTRRRAAPAYVPMPHLIIRKFIGFSLRDPENGSIYLNVSHRNGAARSFSFQIM